jgi:hypothetical protein
MSSHGGPRHALDPHPKQHSAGEEFVGSVDVDEQEMRDQSDMQERARRLRDYHARAGKCLYDQSESAHTPDVALSPMAFDVNATKMYDNAITPIDCGNPIVFVDQPLAGYTIIGGEPPVPLIFGRTHCVHCARALGAWQSRPSSTTSFLIVETCSCFGIGATGSQPANPATIARPLARTAGSATASASVSHPCPMCGGACSCPNYDLPIRCCSHVCAASTSAPGRGGNSLEVDALETVCPGTRTRCQNSRGGI